MTPTLVLPFLVLPIVAPLRSLVLFFFFNDTATTEIYTLSLHDALPILKYVLEGQPNLELKQATIARLLSHIGDDGRPVITGVVANNGWQYMADAIILTTGTFINGRLVVGEKTQPGGRAGEGPALGISDSLHALGLTVRRFKTGTPPRIDARTIDFSKTEMQPGSRVPHYFSQDTRAREDVQLPGSRPNPIYPVTDEDLYGWRPQLPCYLVGTTEQTHHILLNT